MTEGLTFKRLRPELADELLDFLAGAFPDNREWAGCYCLFYHRSRADGRFEPCEPYRADKAELIRSGRSFGVMAYEGDRVVGWVHAAPRETLPRLGDWDSDNPQFRPSEPDGIGAIVCFVIAPDMRGRGIATALVDEASAMFADMGLRQVEAYPSTKPSEPTDNFGTAALNYHGTLSMYLGLGFEPQFELKDMTVVRRPINV